MFSRQWSKQKHFIYEKKGLNVKMYKFVKKESTIAAGGRAIKFHKSATVDIAIGDKVVSLNSLIMDSWGHHDPFAMFPTSINGNRGVNMMFGKKKKE